MCPDCMLPAPPELALASQHRRPSSPHPAVSSTKSAHPHTPASCPPPASTTQVIRQVWGNLGWVDRALPALIFLSMVLGILIGEFAPHAQSVLSRGNLRGVSAPLVVGMLVMMWPVLTAAEFESFPRIMRQRFLWTQIGISLLINWILGPLLMLGLAEATLPDLPGQRAGVILVGVARCIAMVLIWCSLSRADTNFCAVLVIVNGSLQMVLFAPVAMLFINVFDRHLGNAGMSLNYSDTSIAVAVYLGIPLAAGFVTRFSMMALLGRERFIERFLPTFGHLSLIGLLYTVLIIFSQQASDVIHNIGPVFRTMVPLALYFIIQFTFTFSGFYLLSRRIARKAIASGEPMPAQWTYEITATQAFTSASTNFELAIAISTSVWGPKAPQTIATTVGTLVEVPVLLSLSFVAIFLRSWLNWPQDHVRQPARPLMTPSASIAELTKQPDKDVDTSLSACAPPSLPRERGPGDIELCPMQSAQ